MHERGKAETTVDTSIKALEYIQTLEILNTQAKGYLYKAHSHSSDPKDGVEAYQAAFEDAYFAGKDPNHPRKLIGWGEEGERVIEHVDSIREKVRDKLASTNDKHRAAKIPRFLVSTAPDYQKARVLEILGYDDEVTKKILQNLKKSSFLTMAAEGFIYVSAASLTVAVTASPDFLVNNNLVVIASWGLKNASVLINHLANNKSLRQNSLSTNVITTALHALSSRKNYPDMTPDEEVRFYISLIKYLVANTGAEVAWFGLTQLPGIGGFSADAFVAKNIVVSVFSLGQAIGVTFYNAMASYSRKTQTNLQAVD